MRRIRDRGGNHSEKVKCLKREGKGNYKIKQEVNDMSGINLAQQN